ncbi:MAG: hypothetical protein JEY71_11110 [Sphaerochaeta sp.]|nr:hypothetical protein [Sphaerochaeta sp.]
MKKTIAILLVLVLAGAGLFAANNTEATLTINSSVTGVLQIGLFATAPTTNASFASGSDAYPLAIPAISADAVVNSESAVIALAVRTNKKVAWYIDVAANALRTGTESGGYDYLGYNLILDNVTTTVADLGTPTSALNLLTVPAGTGLRVESFPLKVAITPEQAALAVEGSYESTITFTITAS